MCLVRLLLAIRVIFETFIRVLRLPACLPIASYVIISCNSIICAIK